MTTFIVQFGNQEQGVFWKEIEADNLTAAKVKATMAANKTLNDVTMLAIESIDGELLASKNFAGKKAVWESHVEEAQADVAVDATKEQAIASDAQAGFVSRCVFTKAEEIQKPKLVGRWNSNGVREWFLQGNDREIKMCCDVVAPIYHKVQSGKEINRAYTLTSGAAYDLLCLLERKPEAYSWLCFIKCSCGTYVYVTREEALALGALSKRHVISSTPNELAPSSGKAKLSYWLSKCKHQCEPYLASNEEEIVQLCSTNLCDVRIKNGSFIISSIPNERVNRKRFMLSDEADNVIRSKLYGSHYEHAKVGFVTAKCGLAVVVTELEAALLGEEFTQIEVKW